MDDTIPGKGKTGSGIFGRQEWKYYIAALLVYAAITLAMFWPISTGITSTVPRSSDVYNMLWNLWWVNYASFTLHTSIFSTKLLYYPVGTNLVYEPLMVVSAIAAIPLQSVSLALEYNVLFLTGFMLSGLFMFMLVYYLVGNRYAAFIGGLVFAFSPMHIAQATHLNWVVLEWVPLFVLFFLLMLRERRQVYIFGAAISFLLITFMGDFQQGIMTIVFVVFLLAYYLIKERGLILNKRFILGFAEFILLVAIIGSPLLIPIAGSLLHTTALHNANQASTLLDTTQWSSNILSFFLPSPYNGLFTWFAVKYYIGIYQNSNEGVSYLGYSVLFLCAVGLLYYRKSKHAGSVRLWLWAVIIFAWLSIGPLLLVYTYGLTPIPGIYIIYHYIPLFNLVREPGRFDMLATLGLAVLAGFGINALFEKSGAKRKRSRYLYITILFAALILIEYNGIPAFYPVNSWFATPLFANTTVPNGFNVISAMSGNQSIMVLPQDFLYGNNIYTPMAMYYQTVSKKPMIGGYVSRIGQPQIASVSEIPLSMMGSNTAILGNLGYNSTIVENYSRVTLHMLSADNVSVVVVMNGAYNATELKLLDGYLIHLFGAPIYRSNSTTLFSTTNALSNATG